MSSGLLPIITDNVGESDILRENGLDCLILNGNQPDKIADKILEIHDKDHKWKENISQRCKAISRQYNEETQTKEFKKVFSNILDDIYVD